MKKGIKLKILSAENKKSFSANGKASVPLVIVNPKSAGGSTEMRWARIASDLASNFGVFQVRFTERSGHAIEISERAARGGQKFIIACGGDGTVNEVANGILNSGEDVEFGVLPSGTGGDFRRSLGIPANASDATRLLRDGKTRRIDVGRVSFVSHDGKKTSRSFLNVSSFGLSAAINERVKAQNALEWLPGDALRGKAKFAVSTLQEILDYQFSTVRVAIDDDEEKLLNTINFCVANARFFGGGMKIAPDAKLNDGLFDVVNIGDLRTAKIIFNAYRLYSGSHLSLAEVKHRNAKRITVRAADEKQEIFIETDGELPGKLPAVYEIVPSALRVRAGE